MRTYCTSGVSLARDLQSRFAVYSVEQKVELLNTIGQKVNQIRKTFFRVTQSSYTYFHYVSMVFHDLFQEID